MHCFSEHLDRSMVGRMRSGRHLDQGRLSRSVVADEREDLTLVQPEVHVLERAHESVVFRDLPHLHGDGAVGMLDSSLPFSEQGFHVETLPALFLAGGNGSSSLHPLLPPPLEGVIGDGGDDDRSDRNLLPVRVHPQNDERGVDHPDDEAPMIVPMIVPAPPNRLVPPIITAAMTSSSQVRPVCV